MSTAKHTPGPWTFSTDPGGWSYYIHQADGAPYTPEYSDVAGAQIVYTVTGERKEIQEANARLIAAAPDLLDIAIDLVRGCDECDFDIKSAAKAARAAIAKARGIA